ncbi:WhiB family transcriptional regulator [Modestobacter roseus]|uniref:Transcriptional regulator WhiB n=1 Tax=Modestobacter roseus TaxID=1181884 RepID=A0A562ISV0_9ACTN|nr:WhiB family transcriptional regulator [Modestobacter roseus]MQA35028.1 WhiB family transcriptional regulator [Modestobacter roseus]TWH74107.1 WhiB family redox-sensing transcriptional regulator [Modestobacter roseus]
MPTTIEPATTHRRRGIDRTHLSTTGLSPAPRRTLPCRASSDPDLWFAEAPAQLEQAKDLCLECPVRASCLAGALDRAEPWGVWGGEIFDRGVVIPRKRPRGRPPKVRTGAAA